MATSETIRPWRAILQRNNDGTVSLYESKAVLEVTTEEGVTVYRCSVEGCGYEAPQPRSVRSHYGGHVIRGEVEPVSGDRVAVEDGVRDPQYMESERLLSPLAQELYVAMRSRRRHQNEGLSKWCNALVQIIEKNRGLAGKKEEEIEEAEQGNPSEAEAIIGQIKELLGAPTRDEIEEANARAEAAEARNEKLLASLDTLASLAKAEME